MNNIISEFNNFKLSYLLLNKEQDPEICKQIVKENGFALQFVKNKTYDICKIAIEKHGWPIKFIDNPSEELKQLAVKKYALSIKDIKNPSIEVCKIALERNPYVIEFISADLIAEYNLLASYCFKPFLIESIK